jgi:hypothetical protein
MAACDYCGATILWGGTRDGDFVFCNETCHSNGVFVTLIDQIPPEISQTRLRQVHQGQCPECGGPGPVDVHTSHNVTSAFVMTWWNSKPKVCCRSCGVKNQLIGLVWSGALGWWGFPWGLIMTPIQLLRNLTGLVQPPDRSTPTPQLRKMVNLELASRLHEKLSRPSDDEVIEVVEDGDEE